jgi:hypothetical protein
MSDNDITVNDFLPQVTTDTAPAVVTKASKKRKRTVEDDKTNTDELKKRARFLCKCPEQWRSVSKYNTKRLEEFVNEKTYEQDQVLYDGVFDFAHSMYALLLDKLSGGEGFVEQELKADVSLRQCIEVEMANICQYLTNRYKLAALSTIDVTNAKRRQFLEAPPPDPVVEEINGAESKDSGHEEGRDFMEHTDTSEHGPAADDGGNAFS